MELRIAQAAILLANGKIVTLPKPFRHNEIIAQIHEKLGKSGFVGSVQGFVTTMGHFVARKDALQIALGAGQLKKDPIAPPNLYTEDLW
jgi:hypothetical protein